ncbi:MAG: Uncharacterized MFS-type transporter, partial [uncultured Nocardioides sp.]
DHHEPRRTQHRPLIEPRPPGLGRRRRRLRHPGGGRGVPLRARCADRAPPPGVRLVARAHRLRGLAQPGALRPDLAVLRRADGPLRRGEGGDVRAGDDRRGERPHRVHDGAVAAGALLGAAGRARVGLDVDGLRRDDHQPLVRGPARPGQRHPHRGERDRSAGLPPAGRVAGDAPRLARRRGHRLPRRAGRRTARAAPAAQPPGRHRPAGVRRHRRRPGGAAPRADGVERRAGRGSAARRRTQPHLLAALGRVRDLRDDHQRPDRHALRAGGARPRHAGHDGRLAARGGGGLRRRRNHRLGLAHRQGRPAAAAGRLLRAPWGGADDAAGAAVAPRAAEHVGLHRRLRSRLGRDRAADGGTVPRALRRRHGAHRLRLGLRQPPGRRGRRSDRRGRRPRPHRRLRPGVLLRRRAVCRRRRHVVGDPTHAAAGRRPCAGGGDV